MFFLNKIRLSKLVEFEVKKNVPPLHTFTIDRGAFLEEGLHEGGVVVASSIERFCSSSNNHPLELLQGPDGERIRWPSDALSSQRPGDGVGPPHQMP